MCKDGNSPFQVFLAAYAAGHSTIGDIHGVRTFLTAFSAGCRININIETIVFIFNYLLGRLQKTKALKFHVVIFSCLCGRSFNSRSTVRL